MTWFDLSPLRPDEYARTGARRWTEAAVCRRAFEQGIQDAASERHAYQQMLPMEPQA